eukprot:275024_1
MSSIIDVDVATQAYLKYNEFYGYIPKTAEHLISFSQNTVGVERLKWIDANRIIKSPPTIQNEISTDKIDIESILFNPFNMEQLNDKSSIKILGKKQKYVNVVILLDISSSMNHSATSVICQYRSRPYVTITVYDFCHTTSKFEIAKHALISLLHQLTSNDRVSVIAFNGNTQIIQTLTFMSDINTLDLTQNIANIRATGSTNLEDVYKAAIDLFKKDVEYNKHNEYENKIVLLSDLLPDNNKMNQVFGNKGARRSVICVPVKKQRENSNYIVGCRVNVLYEDEWYPASIIQVNDKQIEITYDEFDEYSNECIGKNSDRLSIFVHA